MKINTKNFGQIEIEEKNILNFPNGILAFEDQNKFIIIENKDSDNPFHYLQSLSDKDLAFVIIDPFIFKKDYDINIADSVVENLEINIPEDVKLYTIVTVPKNLKEMTANLSGPIVINTRNNKGAQVVLDNSQYSTRYPIFKKESEAI